MGDETRIFSRDEDSAADVGDYDINIEYKKINDDPIMEDLENQYVDIDTD